MVDFAQARRTMVDGQVRTSDVTDLRLIAAMLAVPRELFVPAARRASGTNCSRATSSIAAISLRSVTSLGRT